MVRLFNRRKSILGKIIAVQLFLLVVLFCFYGIYTLVFITKVKKSIINREISESKKFGNFIIEKEKESIANILNSFALWKELYLRAKAKDISWINRQIGEDYQVNRYFDICGVCPSETQCLYYKGIKLPNSVLNKLNKYFRSKYKIGDEVKEFIYFYVKIDSNIYIVGASPFADDEGKVLSYGVIYFGKSFNRMIKAIKFLSPGVEVSNKLLKNFPFIPLKDIDGKVIGYVIIKFPAYIKRELSKFYMLDLFLGVLLILYAFMVCFILIRYKKEIMHRMEYIFNIVNSLKEMRPDLGKLRELAKGEDEIADIARVLLPLAETIAQRVIKDPLTDAYNREYFFVRLREEIERAKRFNRDLSVAILDIDNFKKVNDEFGHPVGDEVLKSLSHLIKENIRSTDVFARIGGEEFGFILPETNIEGALRVCEKLRSVIQQHEFKVNSFSIRLTASFGVTQVKDTDTVESVYERADRALYEAKRLGKNRVYKL